MENKILERIISFLESDKWGLGKIAWRSEKREMAVLLLNCLLLDLAYKPGGLFLARRSQRLRRTGGIWGWK